MILTRRHVLKGVLVGVLVPPGLVGHFSKQSAVSGTEDALLTEANEEIITEGGDVIIHEDTEP